MSAIAEYKTIPMSREFLPALFNADTSGLDLFGEQALDTWVLSLPAGSFYNVVSDEIDNWTRCDITGLFSDCAIVQVLHHTDSE